MTFLSTELSQGSTTKLPMLAFTAALFVLKIYFHHPPNLNQDVAGLHLVMLLIREK